LWSVTRQFRYYPALFYHAILIGFSSWLINLSLISEILADADRCVMCGLCLPHCPTYGLAKNEAESPRGRIALMHALATNQLDSDQPLVAHLDSCLVCRACEKMCPSLVPYGRLIDNTRTLLKSQGKQTAPPLLGRLLDSVADNRTLQSLSKALRLYQGSGIQWLARKSGVLNGLDLAEMERFLGSPSHRGELPVYSPASGAHRGDVALFTGCIGKLADSATLHTSVSLLNRLGYGVHIPRQQGCCGSLHQHNGETERAHALAVSNAQAFSGLQVKAILGTLSGCTAQLAEASELQQLSAPVLDICDFLGNIDWPETINLRPLPKRVAIHEPCSVTNVLKRPGIIRKMLQRIPEIELVELPEKQCCGAAGSYMITQKGNARALRDQKLEGLRQTGASILVSNNVGCARHLEGGLKEAGLRVEIIHPVELLAQQI
jgi:glycolate oxidase iron-sulfur subunit